jgi:hypothetical protein
MSTAATTIMVTAMAMATTITITNSRPLSARGPCQS